ncbi:hypothetical protein [Bradyrhizobium japonicum]|uniref:hypothetical protein n=1 Tax=Bradyrhizobium japonicum TaxID=375 RepID=UPI001E577A75|nr:hypothetical protein [Bradyrhizobium japonicum]MCD9821216.1 hypothetical protein [Bradyrhizobium japonicum]MEB2674088.1 hypothetical protein [Bradyrhizobium japonicum]WRI93274.1 hypothetical protein R3F75_21015 [Bradyrhizobium japonicum]
MTTLAVIDSTGTIVNRVVIEGDAWTPPEGCTTVEETDTPFAIGGTYIDGIYTPPPSPPAPPPINPNLDTKPARTAAQILGAA